MPKSLNLDNKTSDFLKTVKLYQKNKASTDNTANKFYFPGNFLVEKNPVHMGQNHSFHSARSAPWSPNLQTWLPWQPLAATI